MNLIFRTIKKIFNKIKNIFMKTKKNKEKDPDQDDIYPLW